jgi:hypothetical protein
MPLKDRLFGSVWRGVRTLIGAAIVAVCSTWAVYALGPNDGPTQQKTSTLAGVKHVGAPDGHHARTLGVGLDEPQRPSTVSSPRVLGNPRVGTALVCSDGTWSGASTFRVQWYRDGGPLPSEDAATHKVQVVDEGAVLDCQVTATNAAGATTAISQGVAVPKLPTTSGTQVGPAPSSTTPSTGVIPSKDPTPPLEQRPATKPKTHTGEVVESS